MKIVFISNFLNHHQLPLALELNSQDNVEYFFVANEKTPQSRVKLGYEDMNEKYPFVIRAYADETEKEKAKKLIDECDLAIIGSAPDEYISNRKKENKIIFRYSERTLKNGRWRILHPKTFISLLINHIKFRSGNEYLLAASAYAAKDYALLGSYRGCAYRWGYFPDVKKYDLNKLFEQKKENKKAMIVWVGRFVRYKHPEIVVKLANYLRRKELDFQIVMVGGGELYSDIKKKIQDNNLKKNIELIGSVSHKEVRKYMEQANIFLFTSDKGEGWGAVLNEAMNSGCAVVANETIGSVPYLMINGTNGFTYKNFNQLLSKVECLICNRDLQVEFGTNAYKTVTDVWNPKNAADSLIRLYDSVMNQEENPILEGPCSIDKERL